MSFNLLFFLHVDDDAFNSFYVTTATLCCDDRPMTGRWHCNQEFILYIGIAFTWKPNTVYNTWFTLWRIRVFWDLKLCHWVSVPSCVFQKTRTTSTTTTRTSHLMLFYLATTVWHIVLLDGSQSSSQQDSNWQLSKWQYAVRCTPHTVLSFPVMSLMLLQVKCSEGSVSP
jgi:hypothetical protein